MIIYDSKIKLLLLIFVLKHKNNFRHLLVYFIKSQISKYFYVLGGKISEVNSFRKKYIQCVPMVDCESYKHNKSTCVWTQISAPVLFWKGGLPSDLCSYFVEGIRSVFLKQNRDQLSISKVGYTRFVKRKLKRGYIMIG